MDSLTTHKSTRVDPGPRLDPSELASRDVQELLSLIGLRKRQREKQLSDFEPKTPQQKSALQACMHLVEQYPRIDRGLLLIGPTGTGKTHLLAAMVRAMLEKEQERGYLFSMEARALFCWYEVISLIADYREASFGEKAAIRSRMQKAKILVLDDLGTERDSGLDLLFEVIDYRYEENRPVFITANMSADELLEKYGDRLVSRLGDATSFQRMLVKGPDHRRQ